MNHSTRAVVSRASQTHQTPQMGLAHIEPVIRTSVVKTTPISAEAFAITSHLLLRFQRYIMLHKNTMKKARNATHATGTWK